MQFASRRTSALAQMVAFSFRLPASRLGVCLLLGLMAVGLSVNPVVAQQSGATLVKDINPGTCERPRLPNREGPCGSKPSGLTVHDGVLYFSANDGETGEELWQYDGSTARLVKDINTNLGQYAGIGDKPSSAPMNFTGYQGTLYFAAKKVPSEDENQKIKGMKLWGYDGSTVHFVKNLEAPAELTVYNDALYLVASSDEKGKGLWKYDGSRFRFIKGMDGIENLTVYDGALYFSTRTDLTKPKKILKYDGSSVSLVKKFEGMSIPSAFTVYDGALYFAADDGKTGKELWRYDGASVSQVKDINSGSSGSKPQAMTVYERNLYFMANDAEETSGLWKYDGSTVSPVTGIADVDGFATVCDGTLYFPGNDGTTGTELYRYDGSTTSLAAEIRSGEKGSGLGGSYPAVVYDGALYFSAIDGESGRELWRYQPK